MFSRRVVQAALEKLVGVLHARQLAKRVDELNRLRQMHQNAKLWETMVLSAFASVSTVVHENGPAGPIDVHATFHDLELTIYADIASVSDWTRHIANPVDYLVDELARTAMDLDIDGGFALEVESRGKLTDGELAILALPSRPEIPALVEDKLRTVLLATTRRGASPSAVTYRDAKTHLRIQYRPALGRGVWMTTSETITPTRSWSPNPIWRQLKKKLGQLELIQAAGFSGSKGIILCDAGSAAFDGNAEGIVEHFFKEPRPAVWFVAAIDIPQERSRRGGGLVYRPRLRLKWNPSTPAGVRDPIRIALHRVVEAMPCAIGASRHWIATPLNPKRRHHNAFFGPATIPGANRTEGVRISGRSLMDALAGTRDDARVGHPFSPKLFAAIKADGLMIIGIEIERCIADDDDWVILEFGPDHSKPRRANGPNDSENSIRVPSTDLLSILAGAMDAAGHFPTLAFAQRVGSGELIRAVGFEDATNEHAAAIVFSFGGPDPAIGRFRIPLKGRATARSADS